MVDLLELTDLLVRKGKVRGKPVGMNLFYDEVPKAYQGRRVDPCAIVRHAMDDEERVYVDAEYHDCIAGAWHAGFTEATPLVNTGAYLSDNISAFSEEGAAQVMSGINVLPQGMVIGIGAAPLDDMPRKVEPDWIVVVCDPMHANTIGGVRSVKDGVQPRAACGTSLCGELFAVPHFEPNVIITPGDQGGRMANRIKPEEMFVIVPFEYADDLHEILTAVPNIEGLLDATKREDSEYWERKAARATRIPVTAAPAASAEAEADEAEVEEGAPFTMTMPWDDEAIRVMADAPADIRSFAVGEAEDYARGRDEPAVTRALLEAQMAELGMNLDDMLVGSAAGSIEVAGSPELAGSLELPTSSSGDHGFAVNTRAPVYASETSTIDADVFSIWMVLCDIGSWPQWQPDVAHAALHGPVEAGSEFSWKTGPGSVSSMIERIVPGRVLAFSGSGMGAKVRHEFRLDPIDGGGTRVTVSQSMEGTAVRGMKRMLGKITATSMATWTTSIGERVSVDST
ncbi:MAG: DUF169 domain-containing protein [Acidimicrobiales bacterium]